MKLREELISHPDSVIGEWSNAKEIVDKINIELEFKDWVHVDTKLVDLHKVLSSLSKEKIDIILDIEFGYHSAKFNSNSAKFSIWMVLIAGCIYLYVFSSEDERSLMTSIVALVAQILGK